MPPTTGYPQALLGGSHHCPPAAACAGPAVVTAPSRPKRGVGQIPSLAATAAPLLPRLAPPATASGAAAAAAAGGGEGRCEGQGQGWGS
eukprot:1161417-Pelagomonas_calceolata.AAC.7